MSSGSSFELRSKNSVSSLEETGRDHRQFNVNLKLSKTSISSCPESYAKWYCLNGATCFSITVSNSTLYNCWCPVGYHGSRCDYKHVSSRRNSMETLDEENYGQLAITLALGSPKQSESMNRDRRIQEDALTSNEFGPRLARVNDLAIFSLIIFLILIIAILMKRKALAKISGINLERSRDAMMTNGRRIERISSDNSDRDFTPDCDKIDRLYGNNRSSVFLQFDMMDQQLERNKKLNQTYGLVEHSRLIESASRIQVAPTGSHLDHSIDHCNPSVHHSSGRIGISPGISHPMAQTKPTLMQTTKARPAGKPPDSQAQLELQSCKEIKGSHGNG